MGREFRIISGFAVDGPCQFAPRNSGSATTQRSTTRRSTVMGFVDGHVVRGRRDGRPPCCHSTRAPKPRANPSSTRWPRFHAVDPRRRGGPRRSRQARGLHRPSVCAGGTASGTRRRTRRISRPVDSVHDALLQRIPDQGAGKRSCTATIASTTAWSTTTGAIIAVLDWEICTFGRSAGRPRPADGVLDRAPGDEASAWVGWGNGRAGLFSTATTSRRATARSPGRDLSHLDFYGRRSPIGSSPVSSKACTPGYLGGRTGVSVTRASCCRSNCRSEAAAERAAANRSSGCDDAGSGHEPRPPAPSGGRRVTEGYTFVNGGCACCVHGHRR